MAARKNLHRIIAALVFAAIGHCAAAAKPPTGKLVNALPLKPGYYVRTDLDCRADTSDGGALVLTANGTLWADADIPFKDIVQMGPAKYRVRLILHDEAGKSSIDIDTWTVSGSDRFSSKTDKVTYRWCRAATKYPT